MLKALKMQLSLEIEKSILKCQFITNSHHWILYRFRTQVILKLGGYTIVPILALSSLLTSEALGDPIPLNTQPKLVSLARI